MNELIKYLNSNTALVSLLFSFVVTIATVFYVILTWKLVSETKKLRKLHVEPQISIILQQRNDSIRFLDLAIQNIGQGPAYKITFEVKEDFENLRYSKIKEIGFIKNGIKYLAPDQKIQSFFCDLAERHNPNDPPCAELEVYYYDKLDKKYSETFLFNLSEYYHLIQRGTDPLYQMAQSLKKIQEDINNVCRSSVRLKIDSYNQNDRDGENKQIKQLLKAHEKKQKLKTKSN